MALAVFHPSALGAVFVLAQFVAPAVLLAAGLVALARRMRRRRLLRFVVDVGGPDILSRVPVADFEMLVAEAFRSQGYKVKSRPHSPDLDVSRRGESWVVQCRQWSGIVGVDMVREFHAYLMRHGGSKAFMVTSGTFSDDAITFARDTSVKLVNASDLYFLLQMAAGR